MISFRRPQSLLLIALTAALLAIFPALLRGNAQAQALAAGSTVSVLLSVCLLFVSINRGVRHRRRAAGEIETGGSEALLRSALLSMEEGLILQDREGIIRLCNDSAARILRTDAAGLIGSTIAALGCRFVHEDGSDFFRHEYPSQFVLRVGEPQRDVILGLAWPDEPTQWLLIAAVPLRRAGEEQPWATVITFSDATERRRSEEALRESRAFITAVLDTAGALVIVLDGEGGIVQFNHACEQTTGWEAEEIRGRHFWDLLVLPEEKEGVSAVFRDLRAGHFPNQYENHWVTRSGARRLIAWTNTALVHPDGTVRFVIGTGVDVTDSRAAEQAVRRNEERLRRLHDTTSARYLSLDECVNALLRLGCEFFGLETGTVAQIEEDCYTLMYAATSGDSLMTGSPCGTSQSYSREVVRAGELLAIPHVGHSAVSGLQAYLGAPFWVGDRLHGTLCFHSTSPPSTPCSELDKDLLRLMAQWLGGEIERREAEQRIKDYTLVLEFQRDEMEKANLELEDLANHDGLTGLKNHRAFQERLADEWGRTVRYATPLSLLLLDIDNFKSYNDLFGHPAGDEVLKAVGRVLKEGNRETDFAARYGGEEFAVILPHTDREGALVLAERMRATLASRAWPRQTVTASIGVATMRPDMVDPASLIAAADSALYRSKSLGRNRVTHDRPSRVVSHGDRVASVK